jgi:DnaJ-class molecular chaperone
MTDTTTCPLCEGSGLDSAQESTCPMCLGTGHVTEQEAQEFDEHNS